MTETLFDRIKQQWSLIFQFILRRLYMYDKKKLV